MKVKNKMLLTIITIVSLFIAVKNTKAETITLKVGETTRISSCNIYQSSGNFTSNSEVEDNIKLINLALDGQDGYCLVTGVKVGTSSINVNTSSTTQNVTTFVVESATNTTNNTNYVTLQEVLTQSFAELPSSSNASFFANNFLNATIDKEFSYVATAIYDNNFYVYYNLKNSLTYNLIKYNYLDASHKVIDDDQEETDKYQYADLLMLWWYFKACPNYSDALAVMNQDADARVALTELVAKYLDYEYPNDSTVFYVVLNKYIFGKALNEYYDNDTYETGETSTVPDDSNSNNIEENTPTNTNPETGATAFYIIILGIVLIPLIYFAKSMKKIYKI